MHTGPCPYTAGVAGILIERRLRAVGRRLERLRGELAVTEEQCAHFDDESGDARLRSLVSETPLAEADARSAERAASAMRRHQDELLANIVRLEGEQDRLLDELSARRSR